MSSRRLIIFSLSTFRFHFPSDAQRRDAAPFPPCEGFPLGKGPRDAERLARLAKAAPGRQDPRRVQAAAGRQGLLSRRVAPL